MKKGKEETAGNLRKWISFFNNPNGEAVKEMAKEDEEIKEAVEKLEEISSDEAKIRIAELREKYILDQNTNIYGAEERGRAEGRVEGRTEGRAEGKAEGMTLGKAEEKIEIAKKMKEEKIEISIIAKVTGLTEEEIKKL